MVKNMESIVLPQNYAIKNVTHKIYSWAHWETKDNRMLQGLNASVQDG